MRLLIAAALGWFAGLPLAEAAVPKEQGSALLDPRLGDAEAFGRYADVSKTHAGAVATPNWSLEAPTGRQRYRLERPSGAQPATRPEIPVAPVAAPGAESRKLPTAGLLGLGALGTGVAACGLLLLAGKPRGRGEPVRRGTVADAPAPAEPESLAPISFRSPAPPVPLYVPWLQPQPASDPIELHTEPEMTSSWLAITAEEQRAIDLWDRSHEKLLGLASLEEWLDQHAALNFPKLDVALLKAKLHREV